MNVSNESDWEHPRDCPGCQACERRPRLVDYGTADVIREATDEERRASQEAAENDGGAGVIEVDGRRCYVED